MNIILDISTIDKGGGLQFSKRIVNNFINDDDFTVNLVISCKHRDFFQKEIKKNNSLIINKEGFINKIISGIQIFLFIEKINPKFIYTIFGPAYFITKKFHIVGFAQEWLTLSNKAFKIKNFIKLNLYRNYDLITVETNFFRRKLLKINLFKKKKIYTLGNTINPLLKNNKFIQKKILNKKNDITIFVPSAYYDHKNLEILIDVVIYSYLKFKLLINFNFITGDINFVNFAIKKLKEHNLDKHFIDYGPQKIENMNRYYMSSDFILLPSLSEVSSAVYPESFFFKKPLLTSNLPFARDLCENAAVYFNPYNYKDISLKIFNLYNDRKLQKKLVENGNKVLEKYESDLEIYLKFKKYIFNKKING